MGSIPDWGTKMPHNVAQKEKKKIIFPRKSYEIKKMKTKVVVKLCKTNIVICAHRDTFCFVI